VLEGWIEAGWVTPRQHPVGRDFSELDLARVQLICDLKDELGINDEAVPVILDLLDQIYGMRRALRELLAAVCAQPEPMRRRIAADIRMGATQGKTREAPRRRAGGDVSA
jgi:chaperone modulatory protein CbpM